VGLPSRRTAGPAPLALNAQVELERLELEFGGRQSLVQALTFAKQTKDVRYLLGLIADPQHNARSLAEICQMGRVLPGELIQALASGAELRSQLLAKQHIAQQLPTVVREVMHKAAEYEDDCTECLGLGKVTADPTKDEPNPSPVDCQTCRGGGKLRFAADATCRDLALEMSGLTGKGGGVQVTTNVQVSQHGSSYEGYERMQEAMDRILFGAESGVPAVDATVVDSAATSPNPDPSVDPSDAP
jgi:hypothetical protein